MTGVLGLVNHTPDDLPGAFYYQYLYKSVSFRGSGLQCDHPVLPTSMALECLAESGKPIQVLEDRKVVLELKVASAFLTVFWRMSKSRDLLCIDHQRMNMIEVEDVGKS